jgi:Fe-S cluster assembly protein SufB
MLEYRLKALEAFNRLPLPSYGPDLTNLDFQSYTYFTRPAEKESKDWNEVPETIKNTFSKLGIPEAEQKYLAGVSTQYESEVVYHNMLKEVEEKGVIFLSTDMALKVCPDIFKKYFGTVIPFADNKFSVLNSAVWSGGSFIYVPKGVHLDKPLQSYFRINNEKSGQFERTLIIADDDSYVSYLEGCTAPMRDENQLHAAIVEIIVKDRAEVKYSTVQNWYPGDENGKGGVLNLVTKRGDLRGESSKLSWTQVETGSAITWKCPSCVLRGDNSQAEFYSVAVTNNYQEADTGTKMIHMGKNTKSTIISKGISAGHSQNSYRGLVRATPKAIGARNYSSCDSLLLGSHCGAHTFPYIDVHNNSAIMEHEATTSKISEEQLLYCNQRGISTEDAVGLIVNGYAKEVLQQLPMEFAVEAQKLLSVSLEGSVG